MTLTFPNSLPEEEYNAIEMALTATEKGRGFLRDYLEQNRPAEMRSLLRSISRLHGATIGATGMPGIQRDLNGMLRSLSSMRGSLASCEDDTSRMGLLLGGLEQVEASLLALVETLEEEKADLLSEGFSAYDETMDDTGARTVKLFGELSQLFGRESHSPEPS
jgi:hypothetical protein